MADTRDELTREVVGLFAAVNRRYTQESEAAASAHELTPLQAKALLAADEPVPMRRIAERLHAEPSNVTAIIDRLESRGLVERGADPGDRRVKRVAATKAGRTVVADLQTRMPFTSDPLIRLTTRQCEDLRELLQLILDA
ncbi:MarR family winged helix-turn-helix transcriptional regulator [Streptomyces sp. NPDC094438]|uniref:MarR family winged helix-turn-helix transcriptional regulator n=1 Tax=Streptomyces sp. NPDC094438 TaxID=3366061 RepID=UPI003810277F